MRMQAKYSRVSWRTQLELKAAEEKAKKEAEEKEAQEKS